MLFRDAAGRALLRKPSYKDGLEISRGSCPLASPRVAEAVSQDHSTYLEHGRALSTAQTFAPSEHLDAR